jgi:hypothetical protein
MTSAAPRPVPSPRNNIVPASVASERLHGSIVHDEERLAGGAMEVEARHPGPGSPAAAMG